MIIKFWGVRGSIPTPGLPADIKRRLKEALVEAFKKRPSPDKLDEFIDSLPPHTNSLVGGNTPCLEVLHEGARLIIDAGSGIAPLGLELNLQSLAGQLSNPVDPETLTPLPASPASDKPMIVDLLLTHTHWDHIQGFPFFRPAYQLENVINVYGDDAEHIERTMAFQQATPKLFPIQLQMTGARVVFHTFPEDGLKLGPFDIEALPLPHPGGSLAFKIAAGGATMVFATDYELRDGDPESDKARVLLASFVQGADVFISDTQYTYLENLTKQGWGHSNPLRVVEMALACGVKRFFLFHHDPCYSDTKLFDILDMTTA
ncbi:MAG: MBL fold metallo-hydrolase, partial [Deltaproteobacteria bacterium]|nr:MBL fold metallo-hydrolase [Deltaproteobacteria bacterium]